MTNSVLDFHSLALRLLFISLVALLLLTLPALLHADPVVRYATPTPVGNADCSSWTDACSLQTALASAGSGDEVWVQMGVHKPTDTADRTISFALPAGAAVYGGFAGTETQLGERDWQTNLTVLSGDIDNNDLTDPTGVVTDTANIVGANSYHVVAAKNLTVTARLDGFTITAGQGIDEYPDDGGGGLYTLYSDIAVANVVFMGNFAFAGGGMYNDHGRSELTAVTFTNNSSADMGGGMCNGGDSTLTNVLFSGNSAQEWGGGLFMAVSDLVLTQVVFSDNTAVYGGGADTYQAYQGSNVLYTNVVFDGNHATYGGGLSVRFDSTPTLDGVTFRDNAAEFGGGIFTDYSNPTLKEVTFSGNLGVYGGGMYNGWSDGVLAGVTFVDNQAAADGGGIYNTFGSAPTLTDVVFRHNQAVSGNGGGMHNIYGNRSFLTNVIFEGNTAYLSGGAMFNDVNSDPTLVNVTMQNNTAVSANGGGIYNSDISEPTIFNSVIWGNNAGQNGNQIYNDNSLPVIAYSDVQGSGGSGSGWDTALGIDGGGNLDADPRFVAPAAGDLHLRPDSPAIDAGDNTAVPPGIVTDLDGRSRFIDVPFIPDSGSGTPPLVDMGAYEASFTDLSLAKTVTPAVAASGEMLTFTLTLTNSSSLTVTQVVLTDTLPAHLSPQAVLASGVTITDTGVSPAFVWHVADLAPGQTGVITLTAVLTTPLAAGTYTNTAHVSAANDAWPLNNSASITYTVANVAPMFTSTAVLTASQDAPYTYLAAASDGNGDSLTLTAPVLPGWLSLTVHGDGTAVLSGTPARADIGEHAVTLRVVDQSGLYSEQTFSVAVLAEPAFALYLPMLVRGAR